MSVRRRTLQSNVPKPHQCQICGSRFTRYRKFAVMSLQQNTRIKKCFAPNFVNCKQKKFVFEQSLRVQEKTISPKTFCGLQATCMHVWDKAVDRISFIKQMQQTRSFKNVFEPKAQVVTNIVLVQLHVFCMM